MHEAVAIDDPVTPATVPPSPFERLAVIVPVAGGDREGVRDLIARYRAALPRLARESQLLLLDGDLEQHLDNMGEIARSEADLVQLVSIPAPGDRAGALLRGFDQAARWGATTIALVEPHLLGDLAQLRALAEKAAANTVVAGYPGAASSPIGLGWRVATRILFGIAVPPGSPGVVLWQAQGLAAVRGHLPPTSGGIELLARGARLGLRPAWVGMPGGTPLVTGAPQTAQDLFRIADQMARDPRAHPTALPRGLAAAWRKPWSSRRLWIALGVILAISLALQIGMMLTTEGALFDIESYRIQAETVLHHQNIYLATYRYPYPPLWVWIVVALDGISKVAHLPFVYVVKLPIIAADLAITVLLVQYQRQRLGPCLLSLIPAAIFAFNPVMLFISAGHGQFDALVLAFVLLGFVMRGPLQDRHAISAALVLGLAIALKGYPILLLPYFALTAPYGRKVGTIVAALLPLAACMGVYSAIFGYTSEMFTRVIAYRSTSDFGWHFLLHQAMTYDQIATDARYAIVVIAALVPSLVLRRYPAGAVAFVFATFYALTFDMSVQYLLWLLPFLALALPGWALIYSLVAGAAATSFYVQIAPQAVPTTGRLGAFLRIFDAYRYPTVLALTLLGMSLMLLLVIQPLLSRRPTLRIQ